MQNWYANNNNSFREKIHHSSFVFKVKQILINKIPIAVLKFLSVIQIV